MVLGRLHPDQFPHIFGPKENEPLDFDASYALFISLAKIINNDLSLNGQPTKTVEEIAYGFVSVANESMCRPIREITQTKGYHASQHALACFGGAVSLDIDLYRREANMHVPLLKIWEFLPF